jgi:hypothetical protein
MGIQGLIPFVRKHHETIHISKFKGHVVAVDGYVWLHRGAFSCALDLLTNKEATTKYSKYLFLHVDIVRYIGYSLKKIAQLQQHGIIPLVVLDGANLPAKKLTEIERREYMPLISLYITQNNIGNGLTIARKRWVAGTTKTSQKPWNTPRNALISRPTWPAN